MTQSRLNQLAVLAYVASAIASTSSCDDVVSKCRPWQNPPPIGELDLAVMIEEELSELETAASQAANPSYRVITGIQVASPGTPASFFGPEKWESTEVVALNCEVKPNGNETCDLLQCTKNTELYLDENTGEWKEKDNEYGVQCAVYRGAIDSDGDGNFMEDWPGYRTGENNDIPSLPYSDRRWSAVSAGPWFASSIRGFDLNPSINDSLCNLACDEKTYEQCRDDTQKFVQDTRAGLLTIYQALPRKDLSNGK